MKKKIIGILIITLMIAIAVLPVSGRILIFNKEKSLIEQDYQILASDNTEQKLIIAGNTLRCLRSYWIHIPPVYDGSESVPLVISLHGSMSFSFLYPFYSFRSCWMEGYTDMSDKANEEGFIVVYPKSGLIFDTDTRTLIFAFDVPIYPDYAIARQSIDDVGYIRDLIEKVQAEYNIDSNRIYITGLSNGGDFTYYLGAELSDIIAGIAPVAGYVAYKAPDETVYNYIPNPANPVSVIVFHGTNDTLMPYEENEWGIGVNKSVAFWVEHNECNPVPDVEISESGIIIKETYKDGLENTEVVLYKTVGGDHWWPGNDIEYNENAPWLYDSYKEISATDLIWEFFESHPKQ